MFDQGYENYWVAGNDPAQQDDEPVWRDEDYDPEDEKEEESK